MRVFMCVHVTWLNSSASNPFDLGTKFSFHVLSTHLSGTNSSNEGAQRLRQLPVAARKRRNLLGRRDRNSTCQHQMATDSQFWIGLGALHGVIERRSGGHEGRAGQNPLAVCSDDSLIDSAC